MNTATIPTLAPYPIAPDAYIIPQVTEAPFGYVYINSLVITGREPIIVDTGTSLNRDRWLEQVWSVVDPKDVRWIFLSHDDSDHTGNLMQVLEASPKARLVTTAFSIERLAADYRIPLDRCLWINDGDSFTAGDRTLMAVRPPIFDGPTTRGLLDPKSGLYWAVDSFAAPVPSLELDAADVPDEVYQDGLLLLNRMVSPWHQWLDEAKYARRVDEIQSLPIRLIASAHGPTVRGKLIPAVFDLIRDLPRREAALEPPQSVLEALLNDLPRTTAAA